MMPPSCFTGEMFCLCLMVPNKHVPVVLVRRSNGSILLSPSSISPIVSPSLVETYPTCSLQWWRNQSSFAEGRLFFNQKSVHLRVVIAVLVASLTGLILAGPLGCICTSLYSLTPSPLSFEKTIALRLKIVKYKNNQYEPEPRLTE